MLLVILLIPLNLVSESLKVKAVFDKQCSYRSALRLTSQGMLFNLVLPAGIGTLAGRWMYSDGLCKIQNSSSALLMSLMQTACNILAGAILGFPYLASYNMSGLISLKFLTIIIIVIFSIAVTIPMIWHTEIYKSVFNYFGAAYSMIRPLLRKSLLIRLSLLTVLRYAIYLTQMSLMVYAMVDHQWSTVINSAALYFLLISAIPTQGIYSLLGRSGFAIVAFVPLGLGAEDAVFISLFIYLLNNAIPALWGGLLMFNKANKSFQ